MLGIKYQPLSYLIVVRTQILGSPNGLPRTLRLSLQSNVLTRAAIEQAKSVAEDTIGKIEAMLERQDSAGGDAANNNGTFVQLEMENGNGGLLLENGGLQERAPRGFKKIIKWFQCTVL